MRSKPVLTYPINDPQVVLDYVYHHFIVEKKPYGIDSVACMCLYDTPEGGCAVGCLLPDGLRKSIGNTAFGIDTLPVHRNKSTDLTNSIAILLNELETVFGSNVDKLLISLQKAHDSSAHDSAMKIDEEKKEFLRKLKNIASIFNLIDPSL